MFPSVHALSPFLIYHMTCRERHPADEKRRVDNLIIQSRHRLQKLARGRSRTRQIPRSMCMLRHTPPVAIGCHRSLVYFPYLRAGQVFDDHIRPLERADRSPAVFPPAPARSRQSSPVPRSAPYPPCTDSEAPAAARLLLCGLYARICAIVHGS